MFLGEVFLATRRPHRRLAGLRRRACPTPHPRPGRVGKPAIAGHRPKVQRGSTELYNGNQSILYALWEASGDIQCLPL